MLYRLSYTGPITLCEMKVYICTVWIHDTKLVFFAALLKVYASDTSSLHFPLAKVRKRVPIRFACPSEWVIQTNALSCLSTALTSCAKKLSTIADDSGSNADVGSNYSPFIHHGVCMKTSQNTDRQVTGSLHYQSPKRRLAQSSVPLHHSN